MPKCNSRYRPISAGAAVGTIIYGPIADRHGRKPLLLVALAIYCSGSIVCTLAPSIEALMVGRALQALGLSGTGVIARAVVRDLYEGTHIARQLSLMAILMAFFPLSAPLIGGLVQTAFGWRAIFVVLFGFGAFAFILVWTKLAESMTVRSPEKVSIAAMLRVYGTLLANRSYTAHISISASSALGLIAWLSGAPFVLQNYFGLSPFQFALAFVLTTGGYLVGSSIASRVVVKLRIDRTIGFGAALHVGAGIVMVAATAAGFFPGVILVASMMIYMIGFGLVYPQGIAGALAPLRDRAGAASSLAAFTQQTAGAMLGILVGRNLGADPLPLAIIIATVGCATFALWAASRRIRTEALAAPETP